MKKSAYGLTPKKRFVKLSFVAILLLGLLIAWLGFGERGFIHLYRMEKERQAYLERIKKLEKKNHELLEEIHQLRTDSEYVESVARRELGLIKDNEILYRFNSGERNQDPGKTDEKD